MIKIAKSLHDLINRYEPIICLKKSWADRMMQMWKNHLACLLHGKLRGIQPWLIHDDRSASVLKSITVLKKTSNQTLGISLTAKKVLSMKKKRNLRGSLLFDSDPRFWLWLNDVSVVQHVRLVKLYFFLRSQKMETVLWKNVQNLKLNSKLFI